VLCLDRRLATASYRKTFLSSLPVAPEGVEPGELVPRVRRWLDRGDGDDLRQSPSD
jgi:Rad3-related DNA helicase